MHTAVSSETGQYAKSEQQQTQSGNDRQHDGDVGKPSCTPVFIFRARFGSAPVSYLRQAKLRDWINAKVDGCLRVPAIVRNLCQLHGKQEQPCRLAIALGHVRVTDTDLLQLPGRLELIETA